MPIIKPRGLLKGDRMAELSDEARLYWPFLYAGSNGFGRFQLDFRRIIDKCFGQFQQKPSRETVIRLLAEYRDKSLLFIYVAENGQRWAAWDSAAVQSFYTREDLASPAPPEPEFANWKRAYQEHKQRGTGDLEIDCGSEPGAIRISTISVFARTDTNSLSESRLESQHQNHNIPTSEPQTSLRAHVEKNGDEPPPTIGREQAVEAAARANMAINPDPLCPFWRDEWDPASFQDKRNCISGIYARIDCGEFGPHVEAQYISTFQNFFRSRGWNASLRPRTALIASRGQPSRREMQNEKGLQRAVLEAIGG